MTVFFNEPSWGGTFLLISNAYDHMGRERTISMFLRVNQFISWCSQFMPNIYLSKLFHWPTDLKRRVFCIWYIGYLDNMLTIKKNGSIQLATAILLHFKNVIQKKKWSNMTKIDTNITISIFSLQFGKLIYNGSCKSLFYMGCGPEI